MDSSNISNAPMQTSQIIDEQAPKVLVNYDVALVIQNALDIMKKKSKLVDDVEVNGVKCRGRLYQDSVITICSDRFYRNVVIYRNRTATVVAAITDGIINLYHWELAFVENHIGKLHDALQK